MNNLTSVASAAGSSRTLSRVAAIMLAFLLVVGVSIAQGSATAHAATPGEKAASYARSSLVGKPYVLGGSKTSGFDCSGAVYLAWKKGKANVVPRTSSADLYKNAKGFKKIAITKGATLAANALKPGDLVFWAYNGNKVNHVAIYLGKGEILQTQSGKKSWIGSVNDGKASRMPYALRPVS